MKKIKEIVTLVGGPCVYKQATFEDGTTSGRIELIGQSDADLEKELRDSVISGRDDVRIFISRI